MFKIYSDRQIRSRLYLRRWQAIALFVAGAASGIGLSESGGWPPAAHALSFAATAPVTMNAGCADAARNRTTLRLSCALQQR